MCSPCTKRKDNHKNNILEILRRFVAKANYYCPKSIVEKLFFLNLRKYYIKLIWNFL